MSIKVSAFKNPWLRRPVLLLLTPLFALFILSVTLLAALIGGVLVMCVSPFLWGADMANVGSKGLVELFKSAGEVW